MNRPTRRQTAHSLLTVAKVYVGVRWVSNQRAQLSGFSGFSG